MFRVVRFKSRAPMDFSSCVTCLLTNDFDRPRSRAAAEKLFVSTTRAKIAIRWRSSTESPVSTKRFDEPTGSAVDEALFNGERRYVSRALGDNHLKASISESCGTIRTSHCEPPSSLNVTLSKKSSSIGDLLRLVITIRSASSSEPGAFLAPKLPPPARTKRRLLAVTIRHVHASWAFTRALRAIR